ncbi:NADP-dependent malic enzyme [Radicibacter daui]|uniref:NADP-dependent malic enzyme n=1 Tax=Radicibacter daui TaxID=3064829 RepID=UPI004046F881
MSQKADKLRENALQYHRNNPPGKLAIVATKPMENQRDLALAYSPGVAVACEAIVENPAEVFSVTARGNLVAVISNGTAVLGLGAIGALASKPVMEGKAVLFKKFAGIDVFDIEVDETDPDKFVNVVAPLEPTFGGINLEDIKAPECFYIEEKLRERMNIPVFHDDQHGTAICVTAAIFNGLRLVNKKLDEVKLVASGAGAAALACLDLLVSMGMKRENIWVSDIDGVVWKGRNTNMDPRKERYGQETAARSLGEIIEGADIFLGLSAPRVLKPEMVARMAANPIIMALANPTPEILPEEVAAVRSDAIMATGRSDYPNQVNNVLCFPFIFRGALDCGATTINEEMKIATVKAIADLALAEPSDVVAAAYPDETLKFGPTYLIPKPFDPRLIEKIPPAVVRAAMETGVATRPITDMAAYVESLSQYVFKTGMTLRPAFTRAKSDPRRVVFAEGENDRILMATQVILDEGLAKPVLIGRREAMQETIDRIGLRIRPGVDFEVFEPVECDAYDRYTRLYHELTERKGVTPDNARSYVRTNPTVIAALMLKAGDVDAMICGLVGRYTRHLEHVTNLIGLSDGVSAPAAIGGLVLNNGTIFITDTQVNDQPSAEQIVTQTLLASDYLQRLGIKPKVALLSHSNFGTRSDDSARKMQKAMQMLFEQAPNLEVEGEMHADMALNPDARAQMFPSSRLEGAANLLVMPDLDAANIAHNLGRAIGGGPSIGPVLIGVRQPAHILTQTASVRGIVNMAALACVDAQIVSAREEATAAS